LKSRKDTIEQQIEGDYVTSDKDKVDKDDNNNTAQLVTSNVQIVSPFFCRREKPLDLIPD